MCDIMAVRCIQYEAACSEVVRLFVLGIPYVAPLDNKYWKMHNFISLLLEC
jgi:hypothetical protein